MRNMPEPELDPDKCIDAQGTVWPEHDFPAVRVNGAPSSDFPDRNQICRRCDAEVLPEECEE